MKKPILIYILTLFIWLVLGYIISNTSQIRWVDTNNTSKKNIITNYINNGVKKSESNDTIHISKNNEENDNDNIIKLSKSDNINQLVSFLSDKKDTNWYRFLWMFKFFVKSNNQKWFIEVCSLYYNNKKCQFLYEFYSNKSNNLLQNESIGKNTKIWLIELKIWLFNNLDIEDLKSIDIDLYKIISKNKNEIEKKWKLVDDKKCNLIDEKIQVFTSFKWWGAMKPLCIFINKIYDNK